MDTELLARLGIEVSEEMSEEDIKQAINDKLDEKDKHITQLEDEKQTLSKENEELATSIEGYKGSEEKLTKELEETKTKLSSTEGKLEQITSMYKEQFIKSSDEDAVKPEPKDLEFDVMRALRDCSK